MPRAGHWIPSSARRWAYWPEVLFFVVVEDVMPPEDDLVLLDAAAPPVADELLLGVVVVAAPLPVLGADAEAAGCALDCDVLGFGALWQPASAKRTAEAKINFFIICSPISVGG